MKKFKKIIGGRGYYIALVLCALAIGITGYLYYRNADDTVAPASSLSQGEADPTQSVAVVGTQPVPSTESTEPQATVTTKPLQTQAPLAGEPVMVYSVEALSYNPTTRDWRVHAGVDIAAEPGTEVCAAAEGKVVSVEMDDTMGMTVTVSHADGYETCYASLAEEVSVQEGDTVAMGQTLGTVGNTALLESAIGEHLHFAVSCGGVPMDPMVFLGEE